MGDTDLVYALEIRILDLEKKVAQLEQQTASAVDNDTDIPKQFLIRIERGEHPVRVLREYRTLTQKQLGEKCGLWPNHISAIERGQSFSLKTARRLSQGLDVAPRLLMAQATPGRRP